MDHYQSKPCGVRLNPWSKSPFLILASSQEKKTIFTLITIFYCWINDKIETWLRFDASINVSKGKLAKYFFGLQLFGMFDIEAIKNPFWLKLESRVIYYRGIKVSTWPCRVGGCTGHFRPRKFIRSFVYS